MEGNTGHQVFQTQFGKSKARSKSTQYLVIVLLILTVFTCTWHCTLCKCAYTWHCTCTFRSNWYQHLLWSSPPLELDVLWSQRSRDCLQPISNCGCTQVTAACFWRPLPTGLVGNGRQCSTSLCLHLPFHVLHFQWANVANRGSQCCHSQHLLRGLQQPSWHCEWHTLYINTIALYRIAENCRGRTLSWFLQFVSHPRKFLPRNFGCAVPTYITGCLWNAHFLLIRESFLPWKFSAIRTCTCTFTTACVIALGASDMCMETPTMFRSIHHKTSNRLAWLPTACNAVPPADYIAQGYLHVHVHVAHVYETCSARGYSQQSLIYQAHEHVHRSCYFNTSWRSYIIMRCYVQYIVHVYTHYSVN